MLPDRHGEYHQLTLDGYMLFFNIYEGGSIRAKLRNMNIIHRAPD